MAIFRMYTGPDGKSHWEEQTLAEHPTLTKPQASAHIVFSEQPAGKFLDWHPAPRRQYVVTLSGESEIELDGGRKIRLGPGHILLAEDTTGQGHISRAVGSEDRISLFITLADGAKPPR